MVRKEPLTQGSISQTHFTWFVNVLQEALMIDSLNFREVAL